MGWVVRAVVACIVLLASGAATAQAVSGPPSTPTDVQASVDPVSGVLSIFWSPPAHDGGSPVLAYTVLRNGVPVYEGAETQYVDPSSEVGDTYMVSAKNSFGNGPSAMVLNLARIALLHSMVDWWAMPAAVNGSLTYPYCTQVWPSWPQSETEYVEWAKTLGWFYLQCWFPPPV